MAYSRVSRQPITRVFLRVTGYISVHDVQCGACDSICNIPHSSGGWDGTQDLWAVSRVFEGIASFDPIFAVDNLNEEKKRQDKLTQVLFFNN